MHHGALILMTYEWKVSSRRGATGVQQRRKFASTEVHFKGSVSQSGWNKLSRARDAARAIPFATSGRPTAALRVCEGLLMRGRSLRLRYRRNPVTPKPKPNVVTLVPPPEEI